MENKQSLHYTHNQIFFGNLERKKYLGGGGQGYKMVQGYKITPQINQATRTERCGVGKVI